MTDDLRTAARWLVNVHRGSANIPKGSALWEDIEWLATALEGGPSGRFSPDGGLEALDVDRLGDAIESVLGTAHGKSLARDIAAEYARLATPKEEQG